MHKSCSVESSLNSRFFQRENKVRKREKKRQKKIVKQNQIFFKNLHICSVCVILLYFQILPIKRYRIKRIFDRIKLEKPNVQRYRFLKLCMKELVNEVFPFLRNHFIMYLYFFYGKTVNVTDAK